MPAEFVSVVKASELTEKVIDVQAEPFAAVDLTWKREHVEVSYCLKGFVPLQMRNSAGHEAVKQVTVHLTRASVVMGTSDHRGFDQQQSYSALVVDQVDQKFVSVSKMMESDFVVAAEKGTVVMTDLASLMVIFAGQRVGLVVKTDY